MELHGVPDQRHERPDIRTVVNRARSVGIAGSAAMLMVVIGCGNGGDEARDSTAPQSPDVPSPSAASVVRDCASRIEGPRLDPARTNALAVGPVTFHGLRGAAELPPQKFNTARGSQAWKTVTEVIADTPATVVISAPDRDNLALIYDDFGAANQRGYYRLADGSDVVRFEPCRRNEPRYSGKGTVGPRTQYNGGFLVRKPGCYELEVIADGTNSVVRRAIGFGLRGRGCDAG